MKSTLQTLKEARAKINQGWTQNAYARDTAGVMVFPKEPTAVCWCSVGAINAVDDGNQLGAIKELKFSLDGSWVAWWNDNPFRKKEEVLAMFDATITRLEEQQKELLYAT